LTYFLEIIRFYLFRNNLSSLQGFHEAILADEDCSREDKINNIINLYTNEGYTVDYRSEDAVQFIKKKHFSLIWALLWLCFWGFGLIVYLLYYASKKDTVIHLAIPADKKNTTTDGSVDSLDKLAKLLEKGLITREEFDDQKNRLLYK